MTNSYSPRQIKQTRDASDPCRWQVERREFLKMSTVALFGLWAGGCRLPASSAIRGPMRFGLITDLHYADAPPRRQRFYRESLGKVAEGVDRLRTERAEFLAVLGDIKDMADGETEAQSLAHLVAIERELQRFQGPLYHVLGNHDLDNLSKAQVTASIENSGIAQGRTFYAFTRKGIRFVVLDANYDRNLQDYGHGKFDWKDTNVPPFQIEWLAGELKRARDPVIVFVHQRLDTEGITAVRNSSAVREHLERSGKVLAVFQGHDHPGAYNLINGIHYYTLHSVVEGSGPENNAYAVVDVAPNLDITITGYRLAQNMTWSHAATVET